MCTAPLTIWIGKGADAREVQTACHECLQCRATTVRDWVGRNIAESRTAKACHAVTLTYGRDQTIGGVDHLRAAILTYSDVQLWLKMLGWREQVAAEAEGRAVRRPRYFITGEWGGEKGRTHWHVMLYWYGRVPELQIDTQCVVQNDWDRGFSFYTVPNYKQIWYNCKYILKGQGGLEQRAMPRMSKKPPLGAEYFARVAKLYALQGLAPQTLEYTFPDIRRGHGPGAEYYRFRLAGRSAELFVQAFIDAWRALHGNERWPASQLVDDFVEWGHWRVNDDGSRTWVGKIINPETFHYRPGGQGGHSLAPDPRGPVTEEEVRNARLSRPTDLHVPFNVLMEKAGWRWLDPQTNVVNDRLPKARLPFLTE